MRNLSQYPVTIDEVYTALHHAIDSNERKELIGNLDGFSLHLVEQFIEENKDLFKKFLTDNPLGIIKNNE